jgi:26S proteasome regulatory subunit N5
LLQKEKFMLKLSVLNWLKTLATIKEKNGDVKEAVSILQDYRWNPMGHWDKKEWVEFILEQMSLSSCEGLYLHINHQQEI